MAVFSHEQLETMCEALAPWDMFPDDVLEDVADDKGGVRQLLMVDTPEGERIRTDASVASLVLGLRQVVRACGYHYP